MHKILPTRRFSRSLKKLERSGIFKRSAKENLEEAVMMLASESLLPASYEDHELSGQLRGYRECHIKGDLLLIYHIRHKELVLVLIDIGSHSYLF